MSNPIRSHDCTHKWVCVCMDRNDALYSCVNKCGRNADGTGLTWGVKDGKWVPGSSTQDVPKNDQNF